VNILYWKTKCPRMSGWYWIRSQDTGITFIAEVEGRSKEDDGFVWVAQANRIYLTPGAREEGGDDKQREDWIGWLWAGPIPEPRFA